jgi:hypothetical protein
LFAAARFICCALDHDIPCATTDQGRVLSVSYSIGGPHSIGDLRFTLVPHTHGEATLIITLEDSGGINNGGVDRMTRNVTLQVLGMNLAPSFRVSDGLKSQMLSDDAVAEKEAEL